MIPRLAAAVKRLRLGHYFLIFVLALVMLLVGLVLKGYIPLPTGWAQQLPFLSTTRPTVVAQAQLPEATPTDQAATMAIVTTPTDSIPVATSTGITTVITLTPTSAATASPVPTHTPQSPPVKEQATMIPATPTAPFPADASAALGQIRAEMQDLYQIMRATRVLLKTYNREQPTEEELAAIRAQLTVTSQRIDSLAAQLQSVQDRMVATPTATATPAVNASISPAQLRDLLVQMQEALDLLQGVLADPAADSSTLAQVQIILSEFEGILEQARILTVSMQINDQAGY